MSDPHAQIKSVALVTLFYGAERQDLYQEFLQWCAKDKRSALLTLNVSSVRAYVLVSMEVVEELEAWLKEKGIAVQSSIEYRKAL